MSGLRSSWDGDSRTATIYVRGDLTLDRVPEFLELADAIPGDACRVRIDLAECTFVDGDGVRLILALEGRCILHDRSIRIVRCPDALRITLATGLSGSTVGLD